MLTTSPLWIAGAVVLGSLFWCSDRECVALLLAIWTVAIGILVYSNLVDRFLWIPVLLALFSVFGSILMLAIPAEIILPANITILTLFTVSLELLKNNHRSSVTVMRHRP